MSTKHKIGDVIGIFKYEGKTYKKVWDDNLVSVSCIKCSLKEPCDDSQRLFDHDDPCIQGFHYEEYKETDVPVANAAVVTPTAEQNNNSKSNTELLMQQKNKAGKRYA